MRRGFAPTDPVQTLSLSEASFSIPSIYLAARARRAALRAPSAPLGRQACLPSLRVVADHSLANLANRKEEGRRKGEEGGGGGKREGERGKKGEGKKGRGRGKLKQPLAHGFK